ncbi:MAG: sigma-70 family RNA polymerase sigma factor [Bacteroidota bacterium]|nr:sigma-70 family RNA polymerase sigma factor [Bacteroidota bacterium]
MNTIADIIAGCKKGKRKSQKELYDMFSGKMYAVCLRYTSNADEAKDILQDGFVKVFTNLNTFNFKGSFEGWVRRIMINTAIACYRTKKNIYTLEIVDDMETGNDNVFESLSAEELLKIIRKLPSQYKMVFNLYAIEGYSHKEISGMLGITESTSKSDLSRARAILKAKITDETETLAKVVRLS